MEKFTLSNGELLTLIQRDLSQFLEKDMLPKGRYLLIELAKKVTNSLESFNKLNEELIKKYTPEGLNGIPRFKEDTKEITEEFINYTKDLESILVETHDLEIKKIPHSLIKDIPNKASEVFYRLVSWEE